MGNKKPRSSHCRGFYFCPEGELHLPFVLEGLLANNFHLFTVHFYILTYILHHAKRCMYSTQIYHHRVARLFENNLY